MSRQPERLRWPYAPVEAELLRRTGPYPGGGEYGVALLAVLLGCSVDNVQRWVRQGWLSDRSADRVAIALGRHPSFFWPAWFDAAVA